jgi:serine/threonine-protein kinase
LLAVLSGAAFTGFEGALLLIALSSLLSSFGIASLGIKFGLWGMIMGGVIFAEFRRIIEKFDFLIIGGMTLAAVIFFKGLQSSLPVQSILAIAIFAGASLIAATALFRLIYLLLSRLIG